MTTTQIPQDLQDLLKDMSKWNGEWPTHQANRINNLIDKYRIDPDIRHPLGQGWVLRNWSDIPNGWRIFVNENETFTKEGYMVGTMAAVFCKPGDDQ